MLHIGEVVVLARPILAPRGEHLNRNQEGVVMEEIKSPIETIYRVRFMLASAGHATIDVQCYTRDFQQMPTKEEKNNE